MGSICKVLGCEKPHKSHGFCKSHLRFFQLYGDPLARKQVQLHGLTLKERVLSRYKERNGCWIWLGAKDPNGYGRLNVDGTPELAHRMSYLVHHGDIPNGMVICHKCDNPACINPAHLFAGSQADNVEDMHIKGRARKRGLIGEEHNLAKLTEDDVRAIRASTLQTKQLAKQYGVAESTLHAARIGRTWKNVK